MNGERLVLAGESFDISDSKKVVAGYCFGDAESHPNAPPGDHYELEISNWHRRRWGYLSYDCQRGSAPPPNIVDVMAPVMLNVTHASGHQKIPGGGH